MMLVEAVFTVEPLYISCSGCGFVSNVINIQCLCVFTRQTTGVTEATKSKLNFL